MAKGMMGTRRATVLAGEKRVTVQAGSEAGVGWSATGERVCFQVATDAAEQGGYDFTSFRNANGISFSCQRMTICFLVQPVYW